MDIAVVAIFTLQIAPVLTSSLIEKALFSNEDHLQYWADSFNPVERVNIKVSADHGELISDEILADAQKLGPILSRVDLVHLEIERSGSDRNIELLLLKHTGLVSNDLVIKYPSASKPGSFVYEFLNESQAARADQQHCFFSTFSDDTVYASINLCNQITGYISLPHEEIMLYSIDKDNNPISEHFIHSEFGDIGTESDVHNMRGIVDAKVAHQRKKRALESEFYHHTPLYYEIYFVVDYTLAKKGICVSPAICLQVIFSILNMAAGYFIEFNLHFVVQTIEIWSDTPRLHPNLTHLNTDYNGDDFRGNDNQGEPWMKEFEAYQRNHTEMQKSDVRMAMLYFPLEKENEVRNRTILGNSVLTGYCTENSVIAFGYLPMSLYHTAAVLAHETGHNLGLLHLENTTYLPCKHLGVPRDTPGNPCYREVNSTYYRCMMLKSTNIGELTRIYSICYVNE